MTIDFKLSCNNLPINPNKCTQVIKKLKADGGGYDFDTEAITSVCYVPLTNRANQLSGEPPASWW